MKKKSPNLVSGFVWKTAPSSTGSIAGKYARKATEMGKPRQSLREERNEGNEVERKKILEINKKMTKLTSDLRCPSPSSPENEGAVRGKTRNRKKKRGMRNQSLSIEVWRNLWVRTHPSLKTSSSSSPGRVSGSSCIVWVAVEDMLAGRGCHRFHASRRERMKVTAWSHI